MAYDEDNMQFQLVSRLLGFYDHQVKPKLEGYLENCTLDIAYLGNGQFYFIEPNSFGADYAAGSALFEWQADYSILNNDSSQCIVFRYTTTEAEGDKYTCAHSTTDPSFSSTMERSPTLALPALTATK